MDSEVQKRLKESEKKLKEHKSSFSNIDTSFVNNELAVTRLLLNRDPELLDHVQRFNIELLKQKINILQHIDNLIEVDQIMQDQKLSILIEDLITKIKNEIKDWIEEADRVDEMHMKLTLFEHKKLLYTQIEDIKKFHKELVWIYNASNIKGNTSHITRKYNQLFSVLVSDEYVNLFERTLILLGRPMKVSIQTKGKKGKVYRQLVLEADGSIPASSKNPDKILSEGEKRAVALADFLTEIQLDPNSSGIILDDPVTSLDMAWRRYIANVLGKFAYDRQVIIFTHDLPFLSYLIESANENAIPINTHWIKRGDNDDSPGYIYLNNSPALEHVYKNAQKAEEYYSKAKKAEPALQLDLIRAGFGALRTSYEVLITNDLLQGVVKRFDEVTHFMNLSSIAWQDDIVEVIIEKCGICSRYMEGHSHSDAYLDKSPSVQDFRYELDEYQRISKILNDLRKQKKKIRN